MTIKDLETIAADLYKNAEEAMPLVGGADKKEWMARRLDEIVETKEPALNCLLSYDITSEVLEYLEKDYEDRKEDPENRDIPCASQRQMDNDKVKNHNIITDRSHVSDRNRVMDRNQNVEDPGIIVEEEILIIEDITPDYIQSRKNSSDNNTSCSIDIK